MSSSMFEIKPENVNSLEKRGAYTVCVVSCNCIGILQTCLFAEAGFKILCADTNQALVNNLAKGKISFLKNEAEPILRKHLRSKSIRVTNDIKVAVTQSNIIVIAAEGQVDEKGKIDYSNLENACRLVGLGLQKDALVIVTGIVGYGVTRNLIKETVERVSGFKSGVNFGLAYSPQFFHEQTMEETANCNRILAGIDKKSCCAASTVLETIAKKGVVKEESVETVEAAALFKVMYDVTKMGLANETSFFCEKASIDYVKVQELVEAINGDHFLSPEIMCDKDNLEVQMLLNEADDLNTKLRIGPIAQEVNEETTRHAVNLIRDALKAGGKPLRTAQIALLGISQKTHFVETEKDLAKALAKTLEKNGAKLRFYDPYITANDQSDFKYPLKKSLTETVEGADCIVVLANHEQFRRLNLRKLKVIAKKNPAIVDFQNVLEPKRVEDEGFIYRGLGRGVWKK